MDVTERTRRKFSDPIPGFDSRLRRAIGKRFPSVSRCGDALGLPHSTLAMWIGAEGHDGARNSPRHLDDVDVLSVGLGVSLDWLIFGAQLYPCRDWVEPSMGRRLRRCISERYERAADFRERLGIAPNMLRRWTRGQARPEMYYLRHSAAMLAVSLDWLARGEPWEDTLRRNEYSPAEVSTRLAVRSLERMARRSIDPAVAHGLMCAAKRAGAVPRPRVIEEQATLPFGE